MVPGNQVQQRLTGFDRRALKADVCVVGGGMAGLIAAVSAARHGARTVLVHDRPVLGGNASSEVRMWICGAHGPHNKETGLLEEIQLENCRRNPTQIYSIWDGVLYQTAAFCPGLTLLLNTTCTGGKMRGGRLDRIEVWNSTSQTWHDIQATLFVDCSGDSVLAPITGAPVRIGRESRHEFDEDIEPEAADARTMGNSLLIQLRETDRPQPFEPPAWAYRFESPDDLKHRMNGVRGDNFWWLEVGGEQDTIRDADAIRDDLVKIGYGVLDYVKNRHPRRAENENWTLEWMGMLPGKRESRRYVGETIVTQNDIRAGGRFEDLVAYGGWSMDDHHPAGLRHPGEPTIYHPAPSPYGLPFRCLYSRAVPNLLFAGRNVSVTHAALSSTRVMGTCSLLGQAVGTAAALCIAHDVQPHDLYRRHLDELQSTLMDDDQWLPGIPRPASPLSRRAVLSGPGEGLERLRDGLDRDRADESHAWEGKVGDAIELAWDRVENVRGLRLVFDSDLANLKRMPCSFPLSGNQNGVPASMVRRFRIDYQEPDGGWHTVHRETDNHQRLVRVPLNLSASRIRWVPEATWGADKVRVFAIDALDQSPRPMPKPPAGLRWPG